MSDKVIMYRIGDNVYRVPISTPADDIALAADILANTDLIASKVATLNALDVLLASKNDTEDSKIATATSLNELQESKLTTINTVNAAQTSLLATAA